MLIASFRQSGQIVVIYKQWERPRALVEDGAHLYDLLVTKRAGE